MRSFQGLIYFNQPTKGDVMKKLVRVEEVEGEGFIGLMGQSVTLFCINYIYTGILAGVNDTYVKLEKAKIVYETGPFDSKDWKDAQPLPNDLYVVTSSVESFTVLK
jgi:hypothetical protein